MRRSHLLSVSALICLSLSAVSSGRLLAGPPDFEREIQPLLARCVQCHGPGKARAGLRLDNRSGATAELDSGSRAVVPGKPDQSELLRRVSDATSEKRMPPRGEMLKPEQVEKLRSWIAAGAEWPDHWAYRPLVKLQPPSINDPWPRTPIDAFILAKLRDRGLSPAPPADNRELVRRLTFDLTGLPPTPEEVDQFQQSAIRNPQSAIEELVDRLLASPQYGERMARFWMDVVHFAETHGHDQDRPRENAWPYRDYLIRSFNADKPYGRFVQEQIAGDVLFPADPWATVATGFLAAGPWDESSLRDIREDSIDREIGRYLDRDDIVTTVSGTFISTTVGCARCHDHKFDPVSQEDYYSLQAVFAGIDKANRVYETDPHLGPRRRELTGRVLSLSLANPLMAIATADELLRARRELAVLPAPRMVYCGTPTFAREWSFYPARSPRPVYVLKRGDVRSPGSLARPGTLSCLPGLPGRFDAAAEGQRRAALAGWLADSRNGLTWRSIANRVWQFHFGQGLVDTPNDFGRMGSAPTHRELLDYVAMTLQDNGGSLKSLHRAIVTSAVYRQSCRHRADYAAIDADNRYLWRMNRRRLDAESIHDALLCISGKLDRTMGGPSVKQFLMSPGIHVTPNVDYQSFNPDDPVNYRRSVYRFLFRTLPDPFMDALDCPDGAQPTPVRSASVTALQALAMQNDKFIVRQSEHIAARVSREASEPERQVARLYCLILGREPSPQELKAVGGYASKHGMANACRVLLNSNEFMFVD